MLIPKIDLNYTEFSDAQKNQILKGLEEGYDMSSYIDEKISVEELRNLRKVLFYYKDFPKHLNIILNAVKEINLHNILYLKNTFLNETTLKLHIEALKLGIDLKDKAELKFNKSQVSTIVKSMKNYGHYDKYLDPKFTAREMQFIEAQGKIGVNILSWLNKGYNIEQLRVVDFYAKYYMLNILKFCNQNDSPEKFKLIGNIYKEYSKEFLEPLLVGNPTAGQLKVLFEAKEMGLNYEKILDYSYNKHQLSVLKTGLMDNINIDVYMDKKYSAEQMDMIRIMQTRKEYKHNYRNFDISIIANEKLSAADMKDLIYLYEKFLNTTPHLDINKIFKENTLDECMIILLNYKNPIGRKKIEEIYKVNNDLER